MLHSFSSPVDSAFCSSQNTVSWKRIEERVAEDPGWGNMSVTMDLEGHGKGLQPGEEPERYNEKCGVFGCYNVKKASHTVSAHAWTSSALGPCLVSRALHHNTAY